MIQRMLWLYALLVGAAPTTCAVSPEGLTEQLALGYEHFDMADGPAAWRHLNGKGCTDAAVSLLTSYEEANTSKLTPEQRAELAFHRGQALAFAARNADAIPHFEQSLRVGGSEEWRTYVIATLAFLRGDAAELRRARARYAEIAPGSMREKILKGLEACSTKPYMVAAHCVL